MKSGYAGHDSMRENAEEAFKDTLKEFKKPYKMSRSEVIEEKPRIYKKGGHVKAKKCALGGTMDSMPFELSGAQTRSPGIGGMKRGGVTEGGNPKWKMAGERGSSEGHMKRGGKVKSHHKKMAEGGGNTSYKMAGMRGESEGHMKRGGKAKKCNFGGFMGQQNMADTVSKAVAARNTQAPPPPPDMSLVKNDISNALSRNKGPFGMKKGGKVKSNHKHEREEMAMGGVGKMRHHQATASGKQIKPRKIKGV